MESSANKMPAFGDLTNVSVEKLQELNTLLAKILALPVARNTYAQIIDGNPTKMPYSEGNKISQSGTGETNSVSGNSEPTDRALQEYEKIRKAFVPENLLIDLKLAQEYQNTLSGCRDNSLRLLQIAAASVNALARKIYLDFHLDIDIKPSKPLGRHYITDEFYVNFYHTSYRQFKRYPFGLLDVVGYWAEMELFGGVLLFEREESSSHIINAFMHPQSTSRAFQLSENQVECFAALSESTASVETILPFAKEADARTERTFVRAEEAPLRIYKTEYDKPDVFNWPTRSSCIVRAGDPGAASYDAMMKRIEEKGLDKTPTFSGDISSFSPLLNLSSTAEETSSSSKDDPLSGNKNDK